MNAFLIDTQSLTPDERKKALELLNISCFMSPSMIGSRPSVFMALTELPANEFESLPFPGGCIITDVTGQDLLRYR